MTHFDAVQVDGDTQANQEQSLKYRRDELVAIIQSIESQLSQREKNDPETGRRLSEKEYNEWRVRAISKRRHLLAELRDVKAEISELGEQGHSERVEQMTRIEEKLDRLLAHFDLALDGSP